MNKDYRSILAISLAAVVAKPVVVAAQENSVASACIDVTEYAYQLGLAMFMATRGSDQEQGVRIFRQAQNDFSRKLLNFRIIAGPRASNFVFTPIEALGKIEQQTEECVLRSECPTDIAYLLANFQNSVIELCAEDHQGSK
ncbi:hypothetical protein [Roseibaca calidilacus]|uniref:hypothetical protein n=1 Tax=Roseibaca calidilacus TaxID=1666912 RepID=UPI0011469F4F|nr:hypothetical protein [Roseibaca calidilacus]